MLCVLYAKLIMPREHGPNPAEGPLRAKQIPPRGRYDSLGHELHPKLFSDEAKAKLSHRDVGIRTAEDFVGQVEANPEAVAKVLGISTEATTTLGKRTFSTLPEDLQEALNKARAIETPPLDALPPPEFAEDFKPGSFPPPPKPSSNT